MMMAVEKGINEPINLGSGTGVTIKQIAETVAANVPHGPIDIMWDITKPKGDAKRLMDMTRASGYGFKTEISLEEGIKETIAWYIQNKQQLSNRYNAFTDATYQAKKVS
jgi:GDP-L-fucose synthase